MRTMSSLAAGLLAAVLVISGAGTCRAAEPSPLTLETALRLARSHDEAVKLAAKDLEQARMERSKALKSIFPNVALSTSVERAKAPTGQNGAPEVSNNWSYTLSLNQPIYTGGRARSAMRMADRAVDINDNFLALADNGVAVRTTRAYHGVQMAEKVAEAGRLGVRLAREFLDLARARFDLGDATKTSILRAELELAKRTNDLAAAEQSLALAREGLTILIGGDFGPLADPPAAAPAPGALEPLIARALAARREMLVADERIGIAEEGVVTAKGKFLPVAYANAYYRRNGESFPPDEPEMWGVSLNLDIPLYDRGQSIGDLTLARIGLDKARLQKEQLVKGVRLEVEEKYYALATARLSVEGYRKQIDLANESLRAVRKQYDVGLATDLEVTTAMADLTAASVLLAKGEFDLAMADLLLRQAVGESVPTR